MITRWFFGSCFVPPVPCVARAIKFFGGVLYHQFPVWLGQAAFEHCYVTLGFVTLFGVMLYRITRKLLIYKQCYML